MTASDRDRFAENPRSRGSFAGRISEKSVRDVIAQTDMLGVVRDVVELKKAGSSYKGCCPFHNEKTPSFHVNPGLKLYHCYGCGAGGDAVKFVRETRGLTFVEAIEFLADRLGFTLERVADRPEDAARRQEAKSARGRMLELDREAQSWFRARLQMAEGQKARKYAQERGLTTATIERFGLGAAGTGWTDLLDHLLHRGFSKDEVIAIGLAKTGDKGGTYDRFRDRLMFPIYTSAGDLVGFGGRDLTGDKEVAKYINSSEIALDGEEDHSRFKHFYKKGDCVFGLWQAREAIRNKKLAILVEGNLDVITLSQAGFEHTVCAMGTALTEAQARELKRFTDHVALVFDGDNAGRKAAMKAVPIVVAAGLQGAYVMLPDGEDPDSYVRKLGAPAFAELLHKAPPLLNGYIDALLAEATQPGQAISLQANAAVLQKAGPLLSAIPDPLARDMARDYLKTRLMHGPGMSGALEAHQDTFARYLQQLAPTPIQPQQPVQRLADPTHGEAEIGELEQDFAAVLVWYPALTATALQYGALDLLEHAGLRQALRDLCALGRENAHAGTGLDADAVSQWAQTLPDGRARRAIMQRLLNAPVCKAEHAHAWLVQTTWRLQERQLRTEREQLKQAMSRADLPLERLQELQIRMTEVTKQLQNFRKEGSARQAILATMPAHP